MSVDPAINSSAQLGEALPLSQLSIDRTAIYLFDFDGVISSRFEDDIYKMPPRHDELAIITSAAKYFQIHCSGMELRYQRHLVYQASAWKLQLPIDIGPGLGKAKDAAMNARMFVLTARSGWHAVERLRSFLKKEGILPTEIWNVGRVRKDRQIELICREFSTETVFFIDDSDAHLLDAARLKRKNLSLVTVPADLQSFPDEPELRKHFWDTLVSAISSD